MIACNIYIYIYTRVCVYIYIYICVCVCVCVCVCILYIHTHTYSIFFNSTTACTEPWPLQHFASRHRHNLANNMGVAKWTMGHLQSSEVKKREDWFEPALDINTTLSPTLTPKLFLGIKNIGGGGISPLPPK